MPKGYPKLGVKRRATSANRCAICRHPERARIEALHVAGKSFDKLAEQFGIQRNAIWRHAHRHMSDEAKATYLIGAGKIAQLAEIAAEENHSLVDYLAILRSTLFGQLDRLATENDHVGVNLMAARITEVLRDIARITGQISNLAGSTIINVQNNNVILNSAPFADLQAGLLRVCAAHPEARAAVIGLFSELDRKYSGAPAKMPAVCIEASPMQEVAHA